MPRVRLISEAVTLSSRRYVFLWIGLSATVILYNKWILAYNGARFANYLHCFCVTSGVRPSYCTADFAQGFPTQWL
jgi:hypothetical protein